MKKIFYAIVALGLSLCLASCDKLFDNLEGDLSKMSAEDMYSSVAGLDRLMAALYASLPMGSFSNNWENTEDATGNHSNSYGGGINGFWNYTTMRDVNLFFKILDKALEDGVVTDEEYNYYKGEAHFIRAYYYFGSVRNYGGVPIVEEPLDDYYDGKENAGLYIPRSKEKDTWDYVLNEFQKAADLLPETRSTGTYRATKWAALALKSRAALWAASVSKYWIKASIPDSYDAVKEELTFMKESYAADYYQSCIKACEEIINSGKFALYGATPSSVTEAVNNLTNLFQECKEEEWIFGRSYNNGVATSGNGFDLPASPWQTHGTSASVWMYGTHAVTLDFADICDNYDANFGGVDGTIVTRTDGNENVYVQNFATMAGWTIPGIPFKGYDNPAEPFADKDARFKAWVIYPDAVFRNTTIKLQGGIWNSKGVFVYPTSFTEQAETVDGVTYYPYGAASSADFSGFHNRAGTNDGSWNTTGFTIRKYLDPNSAVIYSQNPWYDVRYAEVLLNYCEAQVELNGPNAGNSKKYLNQIRRRAYFLDERDATVESVIHERRVEFAFENDRPNTLYRRREYRAEGSTSMAGARKHALVCMADTHTGTARYIFVRTYMYLDDYDQKTTDNYVTSRNYYGSISNYVNNDITPNPIQQ